ncbi:MAG: geranylgeranyl reductase family protein [Deltaproteobacteria bacterium]|nr:geranylgeranyl reductase family protein [Deltaproteobacteria bacterium]
MFDVAVIGAGPAGTAAAFDLLSKGLSVLVLDKYEFPRKKACAGGITPKGYHLFRYDISCVVKRECRIVKINPPNKKSFFLKAEKALCYMTKREELDLFSLNKVIEKGGHFKVIKKIQSINETPFYVEIHTGTEHFKASYLIGADGANSIVRRFAARPVFLQKQFAIEADVKTDRPETHKMEFDFSKIKNGYYWVFPKDDHVNIGIYSVGSHGKLKIQQLYEFAKKRHLSGRLEAVKGYPICTGGFNYRSDSKRILLAGDAAGLAERLLGEGIFFAVKSGQEAALSILESRDNKIEARDLYIKKLKEVRSDLKFYNLASKWFYRFPGPSLKALSFPFIHKRFVNGLAEGKAMARILYNKVPVKKDI